MPIDPDKPTAFRQITGHSSGWLPLIAISTLAGILGSLALPLVLGRAVDEALAGRGGTWTLLAVALILLGVTCELVDSFASTACVAGTTAWLRKRLIGHILAIGPRAAGKFGSGDLVTRVSANSVDAAQAGPSLVAVATAVIPVAGSVAMLAYIDIWLVLAFLSGVVLVAAVLRLFTIRTAKAIGEYQRIQGRIATALSEAVEGIRTITAAGSQSRETTRVLNDLPRLREHGDTTWRTLATSSAQAAVVGPLALIGVLAVGGLALTDGRISPGQLLAASQYAMIGAGMGGLTGIFGMLARARAGARRAGEVLAVAPIEYGSKDLPAAAGRLEFQGVTAVSDDTVLLSDVNLTVPAGATVAVVGRSGAGKSILAELAVRLRDPDAGEVRLDGVRLADLDPEVLRGAIGYAQERPVMVGSTVGESIAAGRSRDRLRHFAKCAQVDEFITMLPNGYDTPMRQVPMSGGERQRLGLARAWRAGRLLVLDDATSSLDTITERRVSRVLLGETDSGRSRTRVIITHRLATAASCDLVVWLEDGKVRGVDHHSTLWSTPDYQEVFR